MGRLGIGQRVRGRVTITSGRFGGDDHIVYIDTLHQVDIQVHLSDTILVHNGNAATRAGNVTLVW